MDLGEANLLRVRGCFATACERMQLLPRGVHLEPAWPPDVERRLEVLNPALSPALNCGATGGDDNGLPRGQGERQLGQQLLQNGK